MAIPAINTRAGSPAACDASASPTIAHNLTPSQRQRGCESLLQTARNKLLDLWKGIETANRRGDFRGHMQRNAKAIGEEIETIQIQLTTILGQCRDVLPKAKIEEARRLQGELANLRGLLDRARRSMHTDWEAIGKAVLGIALAGGYLLGDILRMLAGGQPQY